MRGRVFYTHPNNIAFCIPRIVPLDELSSIIPYLPRHILVQDENGDLRHTEALVPREIGAPLINRMLQLDKLADQVYRTYADRIDRIWEISASSGKLRLHDIAMRICNQKDRASVSNSMLWSIHKVLDRHWGFVANKDKNILDPIFIVQSHRARQTRQSVAKWMREYQELLASETTAGFAPEHSRVTGNAELNPIKIFSRKARAVIQSSREIRGIGSDGRLGPSRIKPSEGLIRILNDGNRTVKFSSTDIEIIRFLYDWAVAGSITPSSPLGSVGPSILRAVGMYDEFDLRMEIGIGRSS